MATAFAVSISAQSKQAKSNLEIFDMSISGELEKFFFFPDINRNYRFVFYVTAGSDSGKGLKSEIEFVTGLVKKTAGRNNLNFSIAKDSGTIKPDSAYRFNVDIYGMRTSYPGFVKNRFLGEKTIRRKINADIKIKIYSGGGKANIDDSIRVDYKDEINYDDAEGLETEEYSFTKASPPEVNDFEAVIFPAAIVLISAAATILFFTIRTK